MLFAIFQTHSRIRYKETSAIKHTYNPSIKIGHSDRFGNIQSRNHSQIDPKTIKSCNISSNFFERFLNPIPHISNLQHSFRHSFHPCNVKGLDNAKDHTQEGRVSRLFSIGKRGRKQPLGPGSRKKITWIRTRQKRPTHSFLSLCFHSPLCTHCNPFRRDIQKLAVALHLYLLVPVSPPIFASEKSCSRMNRTTVFAFWCFNANRFYRLTNSHDVSETCLEDL